MKKIFFALLLAASATAHTQTDVSTEFEISSLYELGTSVLPHGNGYAVFGYFGGNGVNGDIFMLQLDENGKEVMRRSYGLPDKIESIDNAVVPVGNNGWLAAGWQTNSINGSVKNGYILRIGSNGAMLWSKTLTIPNYIGLAFHALQALPSGDFIAAGELSGKMAAVRFTENGDVIWSKIYDNAPIARAISLSESGAYLFAASRDEVTKIRISDGALSWVKPIKLPTFAWPDGNISVTLNDILPIGNGAFAITGTALNDIIFEFIEAPYASVWKENGEIQWAYAYADNKAQSNTAYSMVYLPNQKHLLLAGETSEGPGVLRINAKGESLGGHNIPAPGFCLNPVLFKAQGRYMATGGSFQGSMNTFFYCSAGNTLPAASLKPSGRSVLPNASESALLFPNPATDLLQLNVASTVQTEGLFFILNALGQRVWSERQNISAGENSLFFNVESLPPGHYWLVATGFEMTPMAWEKH